MNTITSKLEKIIFWQWLLVNQYNRIKSKVYPCVYVVKAIIWAANWHYMHGGSRGNLLFTTISFALISICYLKLLIESIEQNQTNSDFTIPIQSIPKFGICLTTFRGKNLERAHQKGPMCKSRYNFDLKG